MQIHGHVECCNLSQAGDKDRQAAQDVYRELADDEGCKEKRGGAEVGGVSWCAAVTFTLKGFSLSVGWSDENLFMRTEGHEGSRSNL
ncbi:hypothetical protein CBR_g12346 [Chara braunii]|uniref:Uncharacterized protein n=1 Tax=Chara braunii TaxID=69332 RepID=A0A388KS03_CHABU|nr:hypothetical protein CBR_g12346 [Chara braunii]|eukprot:GBG72778.1 hypothetical protein CBR_g12346 [Chara braunii]